MDKAITLQDVKDYLKIDYDTDDGYISDVLMPLSLEMCEKYIRRPIDLSNCPVSISQARLLIISIFYENRGSENENPVVPPTVHYLLDPFRKQVW